MSRRKPQTPMHECRRQAAKEFGLPIDDWRIIRLATYMCAHEAIQSQLSIGETIDIGYLGEVDRAIEALRAQMAAKPSSGEPLFEIVPVSKKIHSVCERCGHIQPTDVDTPQPDHAKVKPSPFEPPEPLMLPAPIDGGDDGD
jgi:hypothetical protein